MHRTAEQCVLWHRSSPYFTDAHRALALRIVLSTGPILTYSVLTTPPPRGRPYFTENAPGTVRSRDQLKVMAGLEFKPRQPDSSPCPSPLH